MHSLNSSSSHSTSHSKNASHPDEDSIKRSLSREEAAADRLAKSSFSGRESVENTSSQSIFLRNDRKRIRPDVSEKRSDDSAKKARYPEALSSSSRSSQPRFSDQSTIGRSYYSEDPRRTNDYLDRERRHPSKREEVDEAADSVARKSFLRREVKEEFFLSTKL